MANSHIKKQPKWIYLKVIQADYGYGWDDIGFYHTNDRQDMAEMRGDLRSYRENEPASFRIINRRVPNTEEGRRSLHA